MVQYGEAGNYSVTGFEMIMTRNTAKSVNQSVNTRLRGEDYCATGPGPDPLKIFSA